jgi:hypothetical protein
MIRLAAGVHLVRLVYGDAALYPGSGGPGAAGPDLSVGPLALGRRTGELPVTYFPPTRARLICGKPWDWVEALSPPTP